MGDPTLSAQEAAAAIRSLQDADAMIRRRTAGLMWMIWGLVAPAIFASYGFASAADPQGLWWRLLWLPWAAAGVGATVALWRSAGLAMRTRERPPRAEVAWHVGLFVVLVVGSAVLVQALGAPVSVPAAVLAALGVASMLLGAFGLLARDAVERRASVAAGALLVAAAAACALSGTGAQLHFVVGALASGLAFYGAGVLLAMRG